MATSVLSPTEREVIVRRGRRLNLATLTWNCMEGVIAVAAGVSAASIALVGFGVDSAIEVTASVVALWRLDADATAASGLPLPPCRSWSCRISRAQSAASARR